MMDPTTHAAAHWMSFSAIPWVGVWHEHLFTCNLAIVVDDAARCDFSSIRVLIVQEEVPGEDLGLTIKRRDYDYDGYDPGPRSGRSFRQRLTALRSGRDRDRLLCDNIDSNVAERDKLCTVIFKLQPMPQAGNLWATLKPSTRQEIQWPMIIKYEYTQRLHTDPVCLFLESNRKFAQDLYTARILPIRSTSRSPCVYLPFPIIRRISFYACNVERDGWRQTLASFGLVCKAWAPLFDLFFEVFLNSSYDSRKDKGPPRIAAVARSLSENPARGTLIKTYSPILYRPIPMKRVTAATFEKYCKAQNTILRLATSLTHITVASTLVPLLQEFVDILCTLEDVQSFRSMNSLYWQVLPPEETPVRTLSFEDIQRIIARWPRLTKLSLAGWTSPPPSSSQSFSSKRSKDLDVVGQNTEYEGVESMCRIEDLTLVTGELTASQLRFLASPSPSLAPTLQRARFKDVRGISNSEFLAFLTSVASTLVSLLVARCDYYHASKDEEYAIDVAMPNLVSLESLDVEGDHASALSISRKTRRESRSGRTRGRITINNPYSMDLASIVEALPFTGWDSVTVVRNPKKTYLPDLVQEASDIAQARGIDFDLVIILCILGLR
ncbi:hypothetical protein FPV67DRAFT_1473099 [Lyophyllum atratum]|nr:hypothetical protein FPV67DRAFT_1473099 [Lyophyllum atratum]